MRTTNCTCPERPPVNAHKSDGTPISLWTCCVHGNVFLERSSEIVLTELQETILREISDAYKQGSCLSADDISKILNRATPTIEREMLYLKKSGFIEGEFA